MLGRVVRGRSRPRRTIVSAASLSWMVSEKAAAARANAAAKNAAWYASVSGYGRGARPRGGAHADQDGGEDGHADRAARPGASC